MNRLRLLRICKVGKVGNPSVKVGENTAQHRRTVGNVTDLLPTFHRLVTEVIGYVTDFADFTCWCRPLQPYINILKVQKIMIIDSMTNTLVKKCQ